MHVYICKIFQLWWIVSDLPKSFLGLSNRMAACPHNDLGCPLSEHPMDLGHAAEGEQSGKGLLWDHLLPWGNVNTTSGVCMYRANTTPRNAICGWTQQYGQHIFCGTLLRFYVHWQATAQNHCTQIMHEAFILLVRVRMMTDTTWDRTRFASMLDQCAMSMHFIAMLRVSTAWYKPKRHFGYIRFPESIDLC